MTFNCDSCGQERDFYLDYGISIVNSEKHTFIRICRLCRRPKGAVPDVYWDGKPEINLADDPLTGRPRTFSSKGEKSAYLRDRGLQEAGDSYHGAPVSSLNTRAKPDGRALAMEALRKVKQMGRDNRRQEYLRIIKEGRRYA